jgi:galactokinase
VFSPGRINLIGEHTDYNDGFVFPAATNQGIALAIIKNSPEKSQDITNNKGESFECNADNFSAIEGGNWRNYILGIISEIQKRGLKAPNFNLVFAKKLNKKALRDVSELFEIKNEISESDFQKALFVILENMRSQSFAEAIQKYDFETLDKLLYASHEGLSSQYHVSCEELDFLVNQANENPNVLAGRMMGGGFGGCTINLILKSNFEHFKE